MLVGGVDEIKAMMSSMMMTSLMHEQIEDLELEPLIIDTAQPITTSASVKYTK